MSIHEASCYVQIRAKRYSYSGRISEIVPVRVTKKKPTVVAEGCVVVKVRIRIPAAAFEPLQPEAIVDVPLDLVQRPVEVEAGDPS